MNKKNAERRSENLYEKLTLYVWKISRNNYIYISDDLYSICVKNIRLHVQHIYNNILLYDIWAHCENKEQIRLIK